ncbi:unnamed protein product [Ostreobium quekettii]|uniref:Transmembrane protein n=1 Tax=Ostreobium quekettii TaxID=121088 RepID=A0A8S1JC44_9CHLO|nr:unnamed protein product [Ostreobium quekettii]
MLPRHTSRLYENILEARADEPVGAGAIPLWRSTLQFWNDDWERDYLGGSPLYKGDAVMHCFGGLSLFSIMCKNRHNPTIVMISVPTMANSVAQVCWIHFNRRSYESWRGWVVPLVRIWVVTCMSIVVCETSDESTVKSLGVATSLLLTSNVLTLTLVGSFLRVRFRLHVVLIFICACIGSLFAPSFCSKWGDEYHSDFQAIASGIDSVVDVMMLNIGDSAQARRDLRMGCLSVLCFWQWTLGFFLSGAIEYCSEAYSRTLYVISNQCPAGYGSGDLWKYWRHAVVLSFWCMVVGSILVWTVLKMAADGGLDENRKTLPLHSMGSDNF